MSNTDPDRRRWGWSVPPWMRRPKASVFTKRLKASELGHKTDLCSRCKKLKSVAKLYEYNAAEAQYRIQGQCDRCGRRSLDLWPMNERGVLERMANL